MPRGGSKAKRARQVCSAHLVHLLPPVHPSDMSFSDFYASDLTDITSSSDDDGDFTPASVKRTSAKAPKRDQRSPYTIINPLRPPRSTSYSVRALYGLPFVSPFPHSCSLSPRTNHRWIDQLRSRISKRYPCLSSCPLTSSYICCT